MLWNYLRQPPLSAVSAALDWAADDGEGLPSINSLHAKFGTPGNVTPEVSSHDAVPVAEPEAPPTRPEPEWGSTTQDTSAANGNVTEDADPWGAAAPSDSQVDEDGFVKAKGSRGRHSDQRNEFRGSEGGGERGRGRSGFRGERGGEYRSECHVP